jgi:hypothetical protein
MGVRIAMDVMAECGLDIRMPQDLLTIWNAARNGFSAFASTFSFISS